MSHTPPRSIPRVAPQAYDYLKQVLDFGFHNAHSAGFTGRLEKQFAERFGRKYGIAHSNGTTTMQTALFAGGVGVGDEVIVPAFTVFATPLVAFHCNAVPVIADVDPHTWTMDPADVERKITPNTKAIIPVAISGLPCDMDAIMAIAQKHNLLVIEDNAQCYLGQYKGRLAGSIGHFASFSFQASKTLTCGDGGILICSDDALALAARKASTVGFKDLTIKPGNNVVSEEKRCQPDYQRHDQLGWNQRLGELGCAVALAELERLDDLVALRVASAEAFLEVIDGCDWLTPQKTPDDCVNTYWNLAVHIDRDDIVWKDMHRAFIELGGDGYYGAYQPAHLEPVFANLNRAVDAQPDRYPQWAGRLPRYEKGYCPVWEKLQPRIIMLKTNYWNLDDAKRQAEIFAKTIQRFE